MDDNLMSLIIELIGNVPVILVIIYAWRIERQDMEYWRSKYVKLVEGLLGHQDDMKE